MANERRLRANYSFGLLSQAAAATDTTIYSAGFANLPVIDAAANNAHAALTINDPSSGAYEIVWVTGHTAAATSATVVRAREGTTAQAWSAGIGWVHAPTARDLVLAGNPRQLYFDDMDTPTVPDGAVLGGVAWNGQHRRRDLTGTANYFSAPFVVPNQLFRAYVEGSRTNANTNGSVNVGFVRGGTASLSNTVGMLFSQQGDNNDVIYYATTTTTGVASTAKPKIGRFGYRFNIDPVNNSWEVRLEYDMFTTAALQFKGTPNPTIAAGDVLQMYVSVGGTATYSLFSMSVTA